MITLKLYPISNETTLSLLRAYNRVLLAQISLRVATGCRMSDYCCQDDSKKAVQLKVPRCLVSAMAAQWDFGTRGGKNLWNIPDVLNNRSAYDSVSYGANAELLGGYVNNWW